MITGNKKRFIIKHRGMIAGIFVGVIVLLSTLLYTNHQHQKTLDHVTTTMQKEMKSFKEDHIRAVNKLEAGISQDNKRRWEVIGIEKVIKDVNPKVPYETRYAYANYIVDEATKYPNMPSELLAAMGAHESRFREGAESPVGARGMFQVMPRTARKEITPALGIPFNAEQMYDPEYSTKLGAWYLSDKIIDVSDDTLYNYSLALAQYNGGGFGRSCYKNWLRYKNTDDFNKYTKDELKHKSDSLKYIGANDRNAPKEIREPYVYFTELWYAKALLKETREYVPDILDRYLRYVDIVRRAKELHVIEHDSLSNVKDK